jgi:hypothetical protein
MLAKKVTTSRGAPATVNRRHIAHASFGATVNRRHIAHASLRR